MKKALSVLLPLCLLLTFAACAGGAGPASDTDGLWASYKLDSHRINTKFLKMNCVKLHPDGRARLTLPHKSSTFFPECTYTVEDGILLIHVPAPYEMADDGVIARFTVSDDSTLVFLSSSVGGLYADPGARYVLKGKPAFTLLSRPD